MENNCIVSQLNDILDTVPAETLLLGTPWPHFSFFPIMLVSFHIANFSPSVHRYFFTKHVSTITIFVFTRYLFLLFFVVFDVIVALHWKTASICYTILVFVYLFLLFRKQRQRPTTIHSSISNVSFATCIFSHLKFRMKKIE